MSVRTRSTHEPKACKGLERDAEELWEAPVIDKRGMRAGKRTLDATPAMVDGDQAPSALLPCVPQSGLTMLKKEESWILQTIGSELSERVFVQGMGDGNGRREELDGVGWNFKCGVVLGFWGTTKRVERSPADQIRNVWLRLIFTPFPRLKQARNSNRAHGQKPLPAHPRRKNRDGPACCCE